MKLLLTIIMSTVLTGTAFGACSSSSPKECSAERDCLALNKEGQKFTFDEKRKDVKCMQEDTSVATNCLEGYDKNGIKIIDKDAADKAAASGAATK